MNSEYLFFFFCSLAAGEECTTITGLQLPGVLDELFSYDGPLGPTFSSESVSLHLWAPTAQVNAIPIIYLNFHSKIFTMDCSYYHWSTFSL